MSGVRDAMGRCLSLSRAVECVGSHCVLDLLNASGPGVSIVGSIGVVSICWLVLTDGLERAKIRMEP